MTDGKTPERRSTPRRFVIEKATDRLTDRDFAMWLFIDIGRAKRSTRQASATSSSLDKIGCQVEAENFINHIKINEPLNELFVASLAGDG